MWLDCLENGKGLCIFLSMHIVSSLYTVSCVIWLVEINILWNQNHFLNRVVLISKNTTITLSPPNLTVFFYTWGDSRSPVLRLTCFFPSDPNILYFDSSLKWTLPYSSSVQMTCSRANIKHLFCSSLRLGV